VKPLLSLLIIDFLYSKNWKTVLIAVSAFIGFYLVLILPFLQFDFSYWFNYGQEPHYSRISSYHFINDIFNGSDWIKGYIFAIILIVLYKHNKLGTKVILKDKSFIVFTFFTIGILIQAILIQVTSFSPVTVNYYFHSFAFAYIIWSIQDSINFKNLITFIIIISAIFIWKSDSYWKYSQPIFAKFAPALFTPPPPEVVSKGNWAARNDSASAPVKPVIWVETNMKTLKNIRLPQNTAEGIKTIKQLEVVKAKSDQLQVLNMSNLTFLAYELSYTPQKGEKFPLWYHKEVALFDREVEMLCEEIKKNRYDIILFEDMPVVDNFFPYEVVECAKEHYEMVDKFLSPTGYITDSVEVYVSKKH